MTHSRKSSKLSLILSFYSQEQSRRMPANLTREQLQNDKNLEVGTNETELTDG